MWSFFFFCLVFYFLFVIIILIQTSSEFFKNLPFTIYIHQCFKMVLKVNYRNRGKNSIDLWISIMIDIHIKIFAILQSLFVIIVSHYFDQKMIYGDSWRCKALSCSKGAGYIEGDCLLFGCTKTQWD